MNSLETYRHFYAQFIVKSSGSSDERLIAAFSAVPREAYLGPGPWPVFVGSGYLPTVSDDPRLIYQDVLIGLATDRGINNGQPTLHARCLAALAPAMGESVVHIGAGTGYYTAVLAQLVGSGGTHACRLHSMYRRARQRRLELLVRRTREAVLERCALVAPRLRSRRYSVVHGVGLVVVDHRTCALGGEGRA